MLHVSTTQHKCKDVAEATSMTTAYHRLQAAVCHTTVWAQALLICELLCVVVLN
jgi:hypothetical protein